MLNAAVGTARAQVMLKAAHAVASRSCSVRVCTVLLNILNCLLDIGVVEPERPPPPPTTADDRSDDSSSSGPRLAGGGGGGGRCAPDDERKREMESTAGKLLLLAGADDGSTFAVALETVFR